MKLFTAILLGILIAVSFGEDTVRRPDTTYIGNTVKVELRSATKQADEAVEQKRHAENLAVSEEAVSAAQQMLLPTWLSVVLGFITGAGAIAISWAAFSYTNRHATASHEQSKQEMRAYVFANIPEDAINNVFVPTEEEIQKASKKGLSTPTSAYAADPLKPPTVTLRVSNYGKTPAYDVMVFSDIIIDSLKDRPTKLDVDQMIDSVATRTVFLGKTRNSKTILPPTPDPLQFTASLSRLISKDEKSLWEDAQIALYVYGAVVYRDAFARFWRCDFRYMHAQSFWGHPLGINTSLYTCDEGNKETQIDPNNPPTWWPYYTNQASPTIPESRKAPESSEA